MTKQSYMDIDLSVGSWSVSDQYVYRHEFYGGLLVSRYDGHHIETSQATFAFIRALDSGATVEAAEGLVLSLFGNFSRDDVHDLVRQGIVIPIDNVRHVHVDLGELRADLRRSFQESQSRSYLRAPLNLSIYPLMECQLSCAFCFVTEEKWQIKNYKPQESWKAILREARQAGVPFVSILGGEPTLYRGLPALISLVEEIGLKTTFTTNGLYLSDEITDILAGGRWTTPVISLQSLGQRNLDVTGTPPERPLQVIAKLRQRDIPCRVNAVYTGQSLEELKEIALLCDALGVERFSIGHYLNLKNPLDAPSFEQSRQMFEAMHEFTSSLRLSFSLEGCLTYSAYPELAVSAPSSHAKLVHGCEAGNGRGEIMPDGTILPCSSLDVKKWGGLNVFEAGFQRAWDESNAFDRIRRGKTKDRSCQSCKFVEVCNGGCPAVNERSHGEAFSTGDPRCNLRAPNETTSTAVA